MILLKNIRTHYFYPLLRLQNLPLSLKIPKKFPNFHDFFTTFNSFSPSSFFQRTLSTSSRSVSTDVIREQFHTESTDSEYDKEETKKGKKKPLDVLFKETVGLSENVEEFECSEDELGEWKSKETLELTKKLRNLISDVRSLRGDLKGTKEKTTPTPTPTPTPAHIEEERDQIVQSKTNSLHSMFVFKSRRLDSKILKFSKFPEKSDVEKKGPVNRSVEGELKPLKDFSPEMVLFANRLHEEGYLKKANFFPSKKLDLRCFQNHYSRDFLRFAGEKFGQDHQEIAKLLSEVDLKRVALFGCPSIEKKTAFAAKRLRSFFSIQEDIICRPCKLKNSCKVMNQRVAKKVDDLNLADVMRVLTLYDMELVPPQLEIPNEIKTSVTKLLKEVVNFSP